MKKTGPQLDTFQKTLLGTVLIALIAGFGLLWLHPIVHKFDKLIFWRLLFEQDQPAALVALAISLGALLVLTVGKSTPSLPSTEDVALWIKKHIVWIAVASLPVYALLSYFAAHHYALALDEYSAVYQGHLLAAGRLTAPVRPDFIDWMVPDDAQGFLFFVSHARGEVVSPYWPGFALLLAPFCFLGVPWLCNPVLTSLWIYFLYRLTLQLTSSRQAAAWATVFALSSPAIALNATAYYAMPAHLLANTIYCWLLVRGGRRDAFIAGLVGGYALILHNPLPHLLFSLPWLVYLAIKQRRQLLPLLAGYAFFIMPLVMWSPFLASFEPSPLAEIAKGKAPVDHDPFSRVIHIVQGLLVLPSHSLWLTRFAGLCKLVVWSTPGLVALAWSSLRSTKEIVYLRLLCVSFVLTLAAYMFIRFDQGAGWGFRYLHPVWMTLPILAGFLLSRAPEGARLVSISVRRYFALCAILSLFVFIPFRAFQVEGFIRRQLAQVPTVSAPVTLTFIDIDQGYHTSNMVQNDPFLRETDWRVVDRGNEMDAAFAHRVLKNPRLVERGGWGQLWAGDGFNQF